MPLRLVAWLFAIPSHVLHRNLALLAPVLMVALVLAGGLDRWAGAAWIALAILAIPYVLAPFVTYAQTLGGRDASLPEAEPCTRSGTFVGRHWFEFESRPGVRCWTDDTDLATAIRARPHPLPPLDALDARHIRADPRPSIHLAAFLHAVAETLVGMGIGFVGMVVGSGLLGVRTALLHPHRDVWSEVAGTMVLAATTGVFFGLIPAVLTFLVLFSGGFAIGWLVWNHLLAPRRSTGIVLSRGQLRTDAGAIDLDHPDLEVELEHRAHGTQLKVANGSQQLVLHGEHALLQPLAAHLVERRAEARREDRACVEKALGRLASQARDG